MPSVSQKIVVKIGTNVITQKNGLLNRKIIRNLVAQIAEIKNLKIDLILITSGAMGAGRSLIKLPEKYPTTSQRQILAAVGQIQLIHTYYQFFAKHKLVCAQVLATKEDFRDRGHYKNMYNCFQELLKNNIIPIVNENDVVAIDELMFTDNDELAGLIATMLNVNSLIILTSVDGIYKSHPHHPHAQLLRTINPDQTDVKNYISPEKSMFGRGGMLTKYHTAKKISKLGITTYIANGTKNSTLIEIIKGKNTGTKLLPSKPLSGVKRWIAQSDGYEKGEIYINEGAKKAILSKTKANSLLPIGITKIIGKFNKGDIIKIFHENGKKIGTGLANYESKTIQKYLGQKNKKPAVHYDYLFLEI